MNRLEEIFDLRKPVEAAVGLTLREDNSTVALRGLKSEAKV